MEYYKIYTAYNEFCVGLKGDFEANYNMLKEFLGSEVQAISRFREYYLEKVKDNASKAKSKWWYKLFNWRK